MKTLEFQQFEKTRMALFTFFKTLEKVRRVLANIPTYMMFDDHEVTDDWNLNGWWCNRVLTNPDGRQVVANGLASFSLCQAWGNTPERFEGGKFKDLLEAIDGGPAEVDRPIIESVVLPPAQEVFRDDGTLNSPLKVSERWAFDIVYQSFHLIVIDTRTERRFPDAPSGSPDDLIAFPELVSPRGLSDQVPALSRDLAIVVFPPPLIGWPVIEWAQSMQSGAARYKKDCEAPGLNEDFFQRTLSVLANAAPMSLGARKSSVVLLSGDVHFGFGVRLRYSSTRGFEQAAPAPQCDAVIVSLTSSACKNHATYWERQFLSKIPPWIEGAGHVVGNHDRTSLDPIITSLLQAKDSRKALELSLIKGQRRSLAGGGLVADVTRESKVVIDMIPKDWQYTVKFLQSSGRRYAFLENNIGLLLFPNTQVEFHPLIKGRATPGFSASLELEPL